RPVPKIARKSIRRDVSIGCPKCDEELTYRKRSKRNTAKKVECKACKSKYVSRYDEAKGSFYLEVSKDIPEKVECEDCGSSIPFLLNSFPGSVSDKACDQCSASYRMVRYHNGEVRLKRIGVAPSGGMKLTDDIVDKVKLQLPDQPWPKHIHKSVAQELGISNGMAQKAIRKLINDGVFKEQINGQLFELRPVPKEGS
ncbi:hypothetical protein ABMA58_18930, partial [Oceanospirillum sp. HFRX-1_2]